MMRSRVVLVAVVSVLLSTADLSRAEAADDSAASAADRGAAAPAAAPKLCVRAATCMVNSLAVAFLASFLPISAISFHRFRLPRKEQEYTKVVRVLDLGEETAALSIPALKSEYSGRDYWFPVGFSTLVTALGAFAVIFGNRFWDPSVPSLPVFFRPLCGKTVAPEECHAFGMAVIVLAFLGVVYWRANRDAYRRFIVQPASVMLALTGLYWTVQRAFL